MQTVTPYLWFDDNAEEAAKFYADTFKDATVGTVTRYPDSIPGMGGKVMTVEFSVNELNFIGLNGGPQYKFSEAVSFLVSVETAAEVDDLWSKLTADGGEEGQCGWLKDKFGLSWQIVPSILGKLMGDPNPAKAGAVGQALMTMTKIDGAALQAAYDAAE